MTEDEMVGWHHRLDGHEFGQDPGVSDGQGSLASCSLWGLKESELQPKSPNFSSRTWYLAQESIHYRLSV